MHKAKPTPQTDPNDNSAFRRRVSKELEALASPLSAKAGSILFREGDAVCGVYLLRKGAVKLFMAAPNGRSIIYRVVEPGYVLGLPATLQHLPYSLTAEVVEDADLGFIEQSAVLAHLRDHGDLCLHVLEFLSQEMVWIRQLHAARLEGRRRPTPRKPAS